ncbi:hypothetical protein XENORESO_003488 [Xenotaenia resolanae]|uniref:Uncharacterized protein n=1 Tax=Xenotaenia resolanae TaxID=208358 RepID=A0ABV0X6F9_9TELE
MLLRPTHPTANHSLVPGQGQEPQKEALEEGNHTQTPQVPQDTGHPPSRTAHLAAPSRLASPSTKPKPHVNQHCTLPSQDPSPEPGEPLNQRTGHRSQGLRSKEILVIPREPKSQHQTTLNDPPAPQGPT